MKFKRREPLAPPAQAVTTRVQHTVHFYETDAMGVVHHSNYVRYLEHARVAFLAEHDRPYGEYIALGFHVPVTHVEVDYRRACRFADVLDITCWLGFMRPASFGFAYRVECQGELVGWGQTGHAVIEASGRPTRIPAEMHARMLKWLVAESPG
jgi:acyl-CoA thioester hydrolase